MPFLLRAIRRNRWRPELPTWLGSDDVPADPLGDLSTLDNKLSVWYVDDAQQNLGRVSAALAAGREKIDKLDYALIDIDTLTRLGIESKKTPGESPDDHANKNWHYDLHRLSGKALTSLAKAILPQTESRARLLPKKVKELIKAGLSNAELDSERLKPEVRKSL